ncbi:hypothetical protein TWF506_008577 [Arthrobotrys conoides]|uniref:Uncharacterized protein n=1 Tax=Arthrobotrys conoides TaxID=74498 RepID=A0AAN8NMV7_9PEZI
MNTYGFFSSSDRSCRKMGVDSSTSAIGKKYYEPPESIPEHLISGARIIHLRHTYRPEPRRDVGTRFYYSTSNSKSLFTELRRHDMAGIIVEYRFPPTEDEKPKLYLVEDEFESCVVENSVDMECSAVYPESYKGLVTYYRGCQSLESGRFDRPLKGKDLESSSGVSSQTDYDYRQPELIHRNTNTNVCPD